MPAYYRRSYRRRYRFPRRYRRRFYRRSYARRYVNASSRSSIRCKCVCTGSYTLSSGYGDTLGSVFSLLPLESQANRSVNLPASPLFQAYQNLYEEMKMIGMKVQVSVTDQIGGSTLPSLQIYTAWDRRHGNGEADYTAAEIKNSASNNIATALNNNVAKLSRSIYASDLIEKAQWFDSSPYAAAGTAIRAWTTAGQNPNFFCPAFYMCFGSPSLNQGSAVASVHFSVSVTYYVAFRNPRFGGASSSKDLPTREVTFADDDDDMDADAQLEPDDIFVRMESMRRSGGAAAVAATDPVPVERRALSSGTELRQSELAPQTKTRRVPKNGH